MTSTYLPRVCAVVVFGLALLSPVRAHHSQSEFDLRARVDVAGTVTKVDWRSPHAWIYVDVADAKGAIVNWSFELPSPTTLMRRGWTRESLKPGDRVTVVGAPARNHPAIAIAVSITDAGGTPLFTGVTPVNEPRPDAREPR